MIVSGDCTIYHKIFNKATREDDILRIYIPSCFWDTHASDKVFQNGVEDDDSAYIMIPGIDNYKSPKVFDALTPAERVDYWTISVDDKIVKGNIDVSVPFTDLEKLYDDVINVRLADENFYGTRRMHHVQVGGK